MIGMADAIALLAAAAFVVVVIILTLWMRH